MASPPHRLTSMALLAAVALSACLTRGELDPPAAEPSASSAPESAAPTPQEPREGWAALTSDAAAVTAATVLARRHGSEPILVAGVASADQRAAWRNLDSLVVLTTDQRAGARLARSAAATVPTTTRRFPGLGEALAAITRAALAKGDLREVALVDETDVAATEAAARRVGPGGAVLGIGPDVRRPGAGRELLDAVLAVGEAKVTIADGQQWKLDVVREGLEVPGGGQLLTGVRMIAAYGTPGTPSLGVLGEQDVAATEERLRQIAEPYTEDGTRTELVFEMIAAVASASATDDGDYSYPVDRDRLREWVDYAGAHDILVVLDIQPGRTDFLTHAKQYEEFLVQPHVGIGLDPEWRLKDDQVHLRQIGTVDGAEVQQVVDWLSGLVREHHLPQKLVVVHQFRTSMITNRELIGAPDELLVVLHMDGQGSQGAKQDSYDTLIHAEQPWIPGWKNFYDEDLPMADAPRVLALRPEPMFISFQ